MADARLAALCARLGLPASPTGLATLAAAHRLSFRAPGLVRVPPGYYAAPLERRREMIGPRCASVRHLCKSLLFVNKRCTNEDCSVRENSKYYLIIVQYCRKIESHKLFKAMRDLGRHLGTKKKDYKFDVASAEENDRLTGFPHNGVTPIGMKDSSIPIILDKSITTLEPGVIWLGGGEEDLKLSLRVDDFIRIFNPIIIDITRERNLEDEDDL